MSTSQQSLLIVHGGELAKDVAQQLLVKLAAKIPNLKVQLQCASHKPKDLVNVSSTRLCFVIQTIENSAATEEGSALLRFFKRKTHPPNLFESSVEYTVLGLGDSNLLLDRQTTSAKDCNQVAQQLDARLEYLGATRFHSLGMADERTGMTEVEPWIEGLCNALS